MIRSTCRICEKKVLEKILELGPQPLAGGFLSQDTDAIEKEKNHPLPIRFCNNCGLVQTTYVVPGDILFTNYCFSSRTIPMLVEHFINYAKWIKNRFNSELVFEFGCNDGILLEPLESLGIKSFGIDISKNITDIAKNKGLNVIEGFFDREAARHIVDDYGKVDVVTGSNCFPHNDSPGDILEAVNIILKPKGHLCLEIMYAADLLEKLQWDSMYHEHLNYFCLQTLEILLNRYGFHAVHVERLPMHGGSLRVVAANDSKEKPDSTVAELLLYEKNLGLTKLSTWLGFANSVKRQISITGDVMGKLSKEARICGYGAASRATMWVNACNMDYLEFMVDSSPLRSGKLMPGTHTPIVFPEALKLIPPEYIFVPAWNYIKTIMDKESWFKGVWCAPVPTLQFL